MADKADRFAAAAEKAFADATRKKAAEAASAPVAMPTAPAAEVDAAAAKATQAVGRRTARKPAKQSAPRKDKAPTLNAAATPTTPKLKETTMATANTDTTNDFAGTAQTVAADMQERAKAAYDKGTELTADAVEFQRGNLEAMVEAGKILAAGVQDMGRTYADEARTAVETAQADVKRMVAVKSPTELFQLQGEIARRNFDAAIAAASKNSEAMLKLAGEAFAPMSSRMSLAAEKFSKAA